MRRLHAYSACDANGQIFSRSQSLHSCSSSTEKTNLLMESPLLGVCDMESAIIAIITVFHKYSGNKSKLKKAELKHLINNEMSHFIMKIDDNDTLDRLFADLDQNGDLEIDFQEFISLIAMVTSACHDLIPL